MQVMKLEAQLQPHPAAHMLRLRQSIADQQAAAQQTAAAPRWVSRSESPEDQQWIEQMAGIGADVPAAETPVMKAISPQ